jgi:uncharacterized protein YndB with AHSA1/START domain
MELKTKLLAEKDRQEIIVTREFDLPVDLLFKAFVDPEIVEQWMGTKVLKLDCTRHGSYLFETTDPKGNKHRFNGTIHEYELNERITRTFEMENTSFPVQLEYLTFEGTSEDTSKLIMHIVYKSVSDRDNMLKLPFAQGINMAHDRLQQVAMTLQNEESNNTK